jgi:hypothetical protein
VPSKAASFAVADGPQSRRLLDDLSTPKRQEAALRDSLAKEDYRDKIAARQRLRSKSKKPEKRSTAVFNSPRRHGDYQGYRSGQSDQTGSNGAMPILVGASLIAVSILLSTLITALGGRYVGLESPAEDTAWLVDRLTGRVYKCQAPDRGRASCTAEVATGSIAGKTKP